MYEKYLPLVQAHGKCLISVSSDAFLLLTRWWERHHAWIPETSTLIRSERHVCRKRSDQNRRKGVKQNYCLTGMCAVALYWFYIRVSLRILSGACKCEIGKRHSKTATSHRTGDIKGGGRENGVGLGREKRTEAERKGRWTQSVEGQKDTGLGSKRILNGF